MAISISVLARVTVIISALALFAAGCSAPKAERHFRAKGGYAKHVFVVHNKWHAAIVAKTADIAAGDFPELVHFPDAEYIEVSWGDADFFPAADSGIVLALKAAFWSSGSVVHVVGFTNSVKDTYRGAEIIEIELSEREFQRLFLFVAAEIQRPQPGRPAKPRPGLFPQSRFYAGNGKFSVLRNCNTWVGEAFKAAGLPINTGYILTAGSLASQIRFFGTVK